MPSYPRSEIVNDDDPGIYHCCTQVVQQQWLFGYDILTGRDYCYRKAWVEDELRRVAQFMAVEFLDFAVMDNHLHVMVRTRPDVVRMMSDREVALRWCYLCRTAGLSRRERMQPERRMPRPTEKQVRAVLEDHQKLAECRRRLSSLSWMMRLVCQPIALRANKEAGTRGRFFAGRFKSQQIEDEAGLLACSMYINMNPIRAGVVRDPEHAVHTSGYLRVLSLLRRCGEGDHGRDEVTGNSPDPDSWLAPVFLDPRASACHSVDELQALQLEYSQNLSDEEMKGVVVDACEGDCTPQGCSAGPSAQAAGDLEGCRAACDPVAEVSPEIFMPGPTLSGHQLVAEVFGPRLTNRGYLPITAEDFIHLVRWTAERYLQSKPTGESEGNALLLDKVGLNAGSWTNTVGSIGKSFSTSVGTVASLDRRAKDRGRSWLKGKSIAATAFKVGETVAT